MVYALRPNEAPLVDVLTIEPSIERVEKPGWSRLRDRIVRSKGNPDETGFLLETLRNEGRGDFVTAFGVLWALPGEIPKGQVGDVFDTAIRLIRNHYGLVRHVAAEALGKLGVSYPDRIMPELRKLTESEGLGIKGAAARALGMVGVAHPERLGEIKPMLDRIAVGDTVGFVWDAVAEASGRIGAAYPDEVIPSMISSAGEGDWKARMISALEAGNVGSAHPDRVMPTVSKLLGEEEPWMVRVTSVIGLGNIGMTHPDKAIPLLVKLSEDRSEFMREAVAKALGDIGMAHAEKVDEITPTLIKLSGDCESIVCKAASEARDRIMWSRHKESYIRHLTEYREPVYATPELGAAGERMNALSETGRTLCEEFPRVVGLIVFGSTEKGYMTGKSDVDYVIVGEVDDRVRDRLRTLADENNLNLCVEYDLNISTLAKGATENADKLFMGLFFGDRTRLLSIQREFLNRIDPQQWDVIRADLIEQNTPGKLKRYGLSDKEAHDITVVRTILYTPPDHETMKRELSLG